METVMIGGSLDILGCFTWKKRVEKGKENANE